jgi:hypothetical protein
MKYGASAEASGSAYLLVMRPGHIGASSSAKILTPPEVNV